LEANATLSSSGAGAARPGNGCPKSAPAADIVKLLQAANVTAQDIATADAVFFAKSFAFIRVILSSARLPLPEPM
jgi:hypothetical protein